MTDEEKKVAEAFGRCADVRLPDDFADRLVKRIRESRESGGDDSIRSVFARIALVAASLALLLGFVPTALSPSSGRPAQVVAHFDEIRPSGPALPQDCQLDALAFLGFCREVIRRRARTLLERGRKREED